MAVWEQPFSFKGVKKWLSIGETAIRSHGD
jgi:hypothetical protein